MVGGMVVKMAEKLVVPMGIWMGMMLAEMKAA